MSIRPDDSLVLSPVIARPPLMGLSIPALAMAGPAGPGASLLEGQRVTVCATDRNGVTGAWIGGRRILGGLHSDSGACSSVVVTPALLRRETVGREGTVLETTLALPALPMVAVQWRGPDGAQGPSGLELSVTLLPGSPDLAYRGEGSRLLVMDRPTGDCVELAIHPPSATWSINAHSEGGARAEARVEESGPVTLLVTAGTPAERRAALAAAKHLGGHERRAAGDASPASAELLTLRTGVLEIDDGFAWATLRVRNGLFRTGEPDPSTTSTAGVFWAGIGAVSVGDHQGSGEALRWLEAADGGALATLLAARMVLAGGDPGTALRHLRALAPPALSALHAACDGESWPRWSLALRTLADSLRFSAPDEDIARLRAAAGRPSMSGARVRLPMAGRSGRATETDSLLSALDGSMRGGRTLPGSSGGPLDPWLLLRDGQTEEGWGEWRRRLSEGLRAGPAGRGTWDPIVGAPGPGQEHASLLLSTLVYGILGLDHDAPTGRLGLAPAFPSHIGRFCADHIPVDGGGIRFEYIKEGAHHRFELTPRRCRVPPTVVLQPVLSVPLDATARVDGGPADLERSPVGSRTRFDVQLPLDAPRTLEIEAE